MNRAISRVVLWFFVLMAYPLQAAEPRQAPSAQERARTVYVFHQPIVMLQAKFGLTTPRSGYYGFVIPYVLLVVKMWQNP